MTPDHEQRHKQPGRRASDRRDYAAGVVVAAVTDTLFPHWSRKKVIELLTIITLATSIVVGVVTWFSSRFATRQEIVDQVKPVVDTLNSLKATTDTRIRRLEARQDTLYAVRQLIPAMARAQCIQLERWQSKTIAEAAGLPCDSLLSRR